MNEKLVIVPKKKAAGAKALNILWFALACLMVVLAAFVSPLIFFLPAVLFIGIWYFQTFQGDVEYEYTYYDGEFNFARIRMKSRRKELGTANMEDAVAFAKKGDRSVYKYENDTSLKCRSFTSGQEGAVVYELVCKEEKGMVRYEFEPDEEMLDAVKVKYSRIMGNSL